MKISGWPLISGRGGIRWVSEGRWGEGVYVVFIAGRTTAAAFGLKPDVGNASLSFVLHATPECYLGTFLLFMV